MPFFDVGACSVPVILGFVVFHVAGVADYAANFPHVVGVERVVFVALQVDEYCCVCGEFVKRVDDEVDVSGVALVGVCFDECAVVGELEV